MTEIFLYIVNMSITATILAVVVLLLRLLLKKAPKWIRVLLWGLVALRLICPFAVESPFSLMPKTDWIVDEPLTEENLFLDSAPDSISAIDASSFGNDITVQYSYYPLDNSNIEIHRGISISFILSCIWAAGMAVLLLHTVISTVRLRRSIGTAVRVQSNVWESSAVDSPFVLGIIRPRIYVPRGMTEEKLAYVVAHENAHIRRRDHWWKPLGFLLLTVHWFNPVLWLAYILLCRDIEMACDERVIREYNEVQRANYSDALLDCSVNRKMISACPLAFGEVGVKTRIKSVLNYKKPAFWIVVVAVIACAVAAVCFLTNPVSYSKLSVIQTKAWPLEDGEFETCMNDQPTDVWNLNEDSELLFSGNIGNKMYTPYHFAGETISDMQSFEITLENKRTAPVKAVIYRSSDDKRMHQFSVKDGEMITVELNADYVWYMEIKSTKRDSEKAFVTGRVYLNNENDTATDSIELGDWRELVPSALEEAEKTGYVLLPTCARLSIVPSGNEIEISFITEDQKKYVGVSYIRESMSDDWKMFSENAVNVYDAETLHRTNREIYSDSRSEFVEYYLNATLSSTEGQLLFDNAVVGSAVPDKICEYRYVPVSVTDTMRESLFRAYFGDRADEVSCKDEQKDIWQLGETMSGDFYKYETVLGGQVFTLRYSVPNLNPLDDNQKGYGEQSGCTITAEEAVRLCDELLESMTDAEQYRIDYIHYYGNDGQTPFYWICYKKILEGRTVNAYKDIFFFVDDNGVEQMKGAFYDTEVTAEYSEVLSAEQAVEALRKQLDEVNWKEIGISEVSRISLEYITEREASGWGTWGNDLSSLTILPIWRMELGKTEEERILNRNRIIGVHAVTGELIQNLTGMGNYN